MDFRHAAATPAYATAHDGDSVLPMHRHRTSYLTVVLAGSYVEASPDGPLHCRPGTVVLHPPFHAHGDRFGRSGARTLNLDLARGPLRVSAGVQAWQVDDVAALREGFERSPVRLPWILEHAPRLPPMALPGWQVEMVEAVRGNGGITQIAHMAGVSPEHASRTFSASHGMSPRALRAEWRWRDALRLLAGDLPLSQVAAMAGYSDQSHLCRTSLKLAGCSPARLRARIKCVQYLPDRLRPDGAHAPRESRHAESEPKILPPPADAAGRDVIAGDCADARR